MWPKTYGWPKSYGGPPVVNARDLMETGGPTHMRKLHQSPQRAADISQSTIQHRMSPTNKTGYTGLQSPNHLGKLIPSYIWRTCIHSSPK